MLIVEQQTVLKEQTLHKFTTIWKIYPGNNFAYNTNVPGFCYDQRRCSALKEDEGLSRGVLTFNPMIDFKQIQV